MKYWNNTTSQWVELSVVPYSNSQYEKTVCSYGYGVISSVKALIGFDTSTMEYVVYWRLYCSWRNYNTSNTGSFDVSFSVSDSSGTVTTETSSGSVQIDATSAGGATQHQSSFRFSYGHSDVTISCSGETSIVLYHQDFSHSYSGSAEFEYTAYEAGLAHIDNGTAFESCTCHIDNGTAWEQYIPYIDNGTSWEMCS